MYMFSFFLKWDPPPHLLRIPHPSSNYPVLLYCECKTKGVRVVLLFLLLLLLLLCSYVLGWLNSRKVVSCKYDFFFRANTWGGRKGPNCTRLHTSVQEIRTDTAYARERKWALVLAREGAASKYGLHGVRHSFERDTGEEMSEIIVSISLLFPTHILALEWIPGWLFLDEEIRPETISVFFRLPFLLCDTLSCPLIISYTLIHIHSHSHTHTHARTHITKITHNTEEHAAPAPSHLPELGCLIAEHHLVRALQWNVVLRVMVCRRGAPNVLRHRFLHVRWVILKARRFLSALATVCIQGIGMQYWWFGVGKLFGFNRGWIWMDAYFSLLFWGCKFNMQGILNSTKTVFFGDIGYSGDMEGAIWHKEERNWTIARDDRTATVKMVVVTGRCYYFLSFDEFFDDCSRNNGWASMVNRPKWSDVFRVSLQSD